MSSPLCVSLEQTTYYSNGGAFVDNSLGDMGLLMTVRRPAHAHPHTHAHARTRPHLHKYPAHLSFFPIHHRPCHIPPFLGVSRPARGQRVQLPHLQLPRRHLQDKPARHHLHACPWRVTVHLRHGRHHGLGGFSCGWMAPHPFPCTLVHCSLHMRCFVYCVCLS